MKIQLDREQMRALFTVLYQEGDYCHAYNYIEKGVAPDQYPGWIRDNMEKRPDGKFGFTAKHTSATGKRVAGRFFTLATLDEIVESTCRLNEQKLGIAISVAVFEPGARRVEANASALSAFGIDIDPDDFERLVPGATTVEKIIPEVLRRLATVGLVPHALVHSGSGLHVYVHIERKTLTTDEERLDVKDVWYRLCQLLGGAKDRFDLSSVLRLPGTMNWKNNVPKPVRFIAEHTDLARERYSFDYVKSALAGVDGLPPEKRILNGKAKERKRRASMKVSSTKTVVTVGELAGWAKHCLGVAMMLDPKLAELRQRSREAPLGQRSKADYAYACELFKLGFSMDEVEAEISQSAKGQESGNRYVVSTILGAARGVLPTKTSVVACTLEVFGSAGGAVYSIMGEGRSSLSRGETPPAPASPRVGVVIEPPGGGKTMGVKDDLARRLHFPIGRVGICAPFVGEIMRHEYAIGDHFPGGLFQYTATGEVGALNDHSTPIPTTHSELWQRLPPQIKHLKNDKDKYIWAEYHGGGEFRPSARFMSIKDPGAFWLNLFPPSDRALFPDYEEDEDGNLVAPAWFDEHNPSKPRAQAKFGARADLCLAGHSEASLRGSHPPCGCCSFSQCRANANWEVGGVKLDWRGARLPLLTHRAHRVQGLYKPELNEFAGMIIDELPEQVYRVAEIMVESKSGRWSVRPLDCIVDLLKDRILVVDRQLSVAPDADAAHQLTVARELVEVLSSSRERLVKVASKQMSAAAERPDAEANHHPHMKVDTDHRPVLTKKNSTSCSTSSGPGTTCPSTVKPSLSTTR